MFTREQMIDAINYAIKRAENYNDLPDDIIAMSGMSSRKVRNFLNRLVFALPSCSYLEIGLLRGATFISALYQNIFGIKQAIGIDNWSEFDATKIEFMQYYDKFIGQDYDRITAYDEDCFKIDPHILFNDPVDIYFYDGGHDEWEQRKAFEYYNGILADRFIAIVDDWNWQQVKDGTMKAFNKLGYSIPFSVELPARPEGWDVEQWWNGLYVAVVEKKGGINGI